MTTVPKKRAPGRPAVPFAEKKRRNFTFRGTDELHERLSKAAAESGRSVSEEIELRLSRTFDLDGWVGYLDAHARTVAKALGEDMRKQIAAAILGKPVENETPAAETPKGLLAQLGISLKPDGSDK